MVPAVKAHRTILLGAGASRGASYLSGPCFPSVLDNDFFDLLHKLPSGKHDSAVRDVLDWRRSLPTDSQNSLERAFYMLQTRAYLSEKFTSKKVTRPTDDMVVAQFARCVTALLRHAHGISTCSFHQEVFRRLGAGDAIVSFNYDLVAERALRSRAEPLGVSFNWLYGLDSKPAPFDFPMLLRLHGSSNWRMGSDEQIRVRTKAWSELGISPRYRGDQGTGTIFPIFLPFWDKRIEREPWLKIWKAAYFSLKHTDELVVWGYSLPLSDIKARQLFGLAMNGRPFRLYVIDPSPETRNRWHTLFPLAEYSEFIGVAEFLNDPPKSWAVN
jgi:hypothetical protein